VRLLALGGREPGFKRCSRKPKPSLPTERFDVLEQRLFYRLSFVKQHPSTKIMRKCFRRALILSHARISENSPDETSRS
jgi:hypothetical protein